MLEKFTKHIIGLGAIIGALGVLVEFMGLYKPIEWASKSLDSNLRNKLSVVAQKTNYDLFKSKEAAEGLIVLQHQIEQVRKAVKNGDKNALHLAINTNQYISELEKKFGFSLQEERKALFRLGKDLEETAGKIGA